MKNRAIAALMFTTGLLASLAGSGCANSPAVTQNGQGTVTWADIDAQNAEIHRLLHTDRPWLPSVPPEGSTDMPPFAACFDPDFPPSPEIVAQVNTLIRGSLAKYNAVDRWTSTSVNGINIPAGTPITLRVSFVPDTVSAPDLNNAFAPSTLFATMDQKFGGNRALWISRIQAAFERWSAITGVTYQFVTAPGVDWDDGAAWGTAGSATRGDVRIAMRTMDGTNGVLAFNSYPNNGDMVLDSAENWANSANTHRFLRNIIMHEHGHGLGLAHVCPIIQTKLMEPNYTGTFDGPQQDDLRGIHFRYGDVNEPNNNSAAATLMGSISPGQSFVVGTVPSPTISNGSLVSLGIDGDQDWYKYDTSSPSLISVTVTPLGTTYDSAAQSGSSCPTGSPVNALAQSDVAVAVIGSNGSTILSSATSAAIGVAETDASVLVPGGTSFYIRVYETGAQTQSQMYRLSVASAAPTIFTASDGNFFDGIHLSWTPIEGAASYQVWRSESESRIEATPVATLAGTSTIDTEVNPGQVYYYWLRTAQGSNTAIDVAGPEAGSIVGCRADLGAQGGGSGSDGVLDNNDFIVFISFFFLPDPRADFGGQGGVPGGDGIYDNNDFIVFINAFFEGC